METKEQLQLDVLSFDFRARYKFARTIADGDHIEQLIKAMAITLREDFDPLRLNTRRKLKKQYRAGLFSQFMGVGVRKRDNKKIVLFFSFFKYRQHTYCILFSTPKDKFDSGMRRKMHLVLNNIKKIKM